MAKNGCRVDPMATTMTVVTVVARFLDGTQDMRIAIIGAGISGLSCAWLLHREHEITVYESTSVPGGHSNTVNFDQDGREFRIDTGFIVYNDRTYPNFMQLLSHLGVEGQPASMSFSVRCERSGIEYCGSSLQGLFAQRRNLFRPAFLGMIRDILRFNAIGTSEASELPADMTVGSFLESQRLGRTFAELYLLPMGAAIWSCPTGVFRDFPIRFILEFYRNHGLLSLRNRPQWYTIPGGSRIYVDRLTSSFRDRIRLNVPVRRVTRSSRQVQVLTDHDEQPFDEVIFACHSDQALRMLPDATELERTVLAAFPWSANEVVLHTDTSVLPRRKDAWAAWNYRIGTESAELATLSYNMNLLQQIDSPQTFCVTLNGSDLISPAKVISRHRYSHPVFTTTRSEMQARQPELIRSNRSSFCGAYWGNGFHEDGVVSALAVCRRFGIQHISQAAGQPVSVPPSADSESANSRPVPSGTALYEGVVCE